MPDPASCVRSLLKIHADFPHKGLHCLLAQINRLRSATRDESDVGDANHSKYQAQISGCDVAVLDGRPWGIDASGCDQNGCLLAGHQAAAIEAERQSLADYMVDPCFQDC